MDYLQYAELRHSGILGMKWGVRRYQNKDGTLTEAGKKRYSKLNKEIQKLAPKQETPKKPSISEMSNDDLQRSINRMFLEKQYVQLVKDLTPPKADSKAKKLIKSVATKVLAPVAVDVSKRYLTKVASDALKLPAQQQQQKKK